MILIGFMFGIYLLVLVFMWFFEFSGYGVSLWGFYLGFLVFGVLLVNMFEVYLF